MKNSKTYFELTEEEREKFGYPKLPVNLEMKKSFENFLNWVKEGKIKFLETERFIYSKKYKYCGTMDFLAEINGEIWVGDIKTSSGIWNEYYLQIAAYQQAYLEEFPKLKIKGGIIVRVGKDATLEIKNTTEKDVPPYKLNIIAFNYALNLYRTLKKVKEYEK